MPESIQKKLDRIRPPRVQITYDVEIGDAIQMKELPFVGGILADLSGMPEEPLPKVRDRKFVEIDRDNFNEVMASMKPRLAMRVDNKLSNDGSKLNVVLNLAHMDDFNPVNIVQQVKPLRKLYEARQRLTDLLTKLDGNDDLDQLIQDVIHNTEQLEELKSLVGGSDGDGAEGQEAAAEAAEAEGGESGDASSDASDEAPEEES